MHGDEQSPSPRGGFVPGTVNRFHDRGCSDRTLSTNTRSILDTSASKCHAALACGLKSPPPPIQPIRETSIRAATMSWRCGTLSPVKPFSIPPPTGVPAAARRRTGIQVTRKGEPSADTNRYPGTEMRRTRYRGKGELDGSAIERGTMTTREQYLNDWTTDGYALVEDFLTPAELAAASGSSRRCFPPGTNMRPARIVTGMTRSAATCASCHSSGAR